MTTNPNTIIEKKHSFRVGQLVKVRETVRGAHEYIDKGGKIKEITTSGVYISNCISAKRYSANQVYFSFDEVYKP